MSNWISVNERLPDLGQDVLAVDKHGDIEMVMVISSFGGKLRLSPNEHEYSTLGTITHWQPLPAPPAECE